jgi:hypothetical protein
MKRISSKMLPWIGVILMSAAVLVAQETQNHIVTYEGGADANSHRPDFAGATIAIDFEGPAARKAVDLFHHLGATHFVIGHNPCVSSTPVDVVCVRIIQGIPGSAQSSNYGSHGGISTGGSSSGQLTPIILTVFLVEYNDGATRPTIPLGDAMCYASSGSGSEWSSGSGKSGSWSYMSSSTTDLSGSNSGVAIAQDLDALLMKMSWKNSLSKFLAMGNNAGWIPGANETVAEHFRSNKQKAGGAE